MSLHRQFAGSAITTARNAVSSSRLAPRLRPLALCLSAALLGQACWPLAASAAPQQSWQVQNCDDNGPDSLRDIIENPVKAQSGDTVDLTQLPQPCGMNASTITLSGGEIAVHQDALTLLGPADGSVKISGNGTNRVFHHDGVGTLQIQSLTVSDGYYHAAGNAYGGCIESDAGNVYLINAVVSDCVVSSDTGWASGGGISARNGGVALKLSTISGNQANAPGKSGWGGGVYSNGVATVKYSTIVGNAEHDAVAGPPGSGGGLRAIGGATVRESTVSGNSAGYASGIESDGPFEITNSTISGNTASMRSAVTIYGTNAATIANSTIAFNHEASATGAVYFWAPSPNATLTLQSSILANNTDSANAPADLRIGVGHGALDPSGADNLVMASNIASPPAGVITLISDPMLGPLQLNGGVTATHLPMPGSPVLGVGNNNTAVLIDQRGRGYPRTTGTNVDIGAVQFDTIFVGDFDIDI